MRRSTFNELSFLLLNSTLLSIALLLLSSAFFSSCSSQLITTLGLFGALIVLITTLITLICYPSKSVSFSSISGETSVSYDIVILLLEEQRKIKFNDVFECVDVISFSKDDIECSVKYKKNIALSIHHQVEFQKAVECIFTKSFDYNGRITVDYFL